MDYTEFKEIQIPKLNNLSFEVLDNNHWPALRRESFIIIREDVVE